MRIVQREKVSNKAACSTSPSAMKRSSESEAEGSDATVSTKPALGMIVMDSVIPVAVLRRYAAAAAAAAAAMLSVAIPDVAATAAATAAMKNKDDDGGLDCDTLKRVTPSPSASTTSIAL